jgi:hypothetical protein
MLLGWFGVGSHLIFPVYQSVIEVSDTWQHTHSHIVYAYILCGVEDRELFLVLCQLLVVELAMPYVTGLVEDQRQYLIKVLYLGVGWQSDDTFLWVCLRCDVRVELYDYVILFSNPGCDNFKSSTSL